MNVQQREHTTVHLHDDGCKASVIRTHDHQFHHRYIRYSKHCKIKDVSYVSPEKHRIASDKHKQPVRIAQISLPDVSVNTSHNAAQTL